MADPLKFNFPLAVLLHDGDALLNAAVKYTAQLGPRLPENHAADTRTLLDTVAGQDTRQKSAAGDVGTLTQTQNAQLAELQDKITAARDTAKQAFKGNAVKLREEFQVGSHKPADLASVIQRARIILAGLQKAENRAALQAKGWRAADTTEFEAAITALDTADNVQETAKKTKAGGTGERNRQANQLYDALLAIQNAANLQWPASKSATAAVREEFLLSTFPPRVAPPEKKPVTTTPTATTTTTTT